MAWIGIVTRAMKKGAVKVDKRNAWRNFVAE